MHYPEEAASALRTFDPRSMTPAFKSAVEAVTPSESPDGRHMGGKDLIPIAVGAKTSSRKRMKSC